MLNAVYEEGFLGFSSGFRPSRGQHDALDALCVGITGTKVSFILDADIRSFFDEVSREWLVKFLKHWIGDSHIIRLSQTWLKAGILENAEIKVGDRGTPQGAMRERLEAFSPTLHPEKTRLIRFGRFTAPERARRGLGKPETFDFLGFTFICGKTRQGKVLLMRKTRRDRMRAKLQELKEELRRRRHQSIPVQGPWLGQVVGGFLNYHAVPTSHRALCAFRDHVVDLWRRSLERRSQRDKTRWDGMRKLADDWLPKPRILPPWPRDRFAVKHPRWEPSARIGPARFCAVGRSVMMPLANATGQLPPAERPEKRPSDLNRRLTNEKATSNSPAVSVMGVPTAIATRGRRSGTRPAGPPPE